MSYGPKTRVMLTPEQVRAHADAATAIASKILKGFERSPDKPYDQALAAYMVCAGLCKAFGWSPQDFHQWVADQFPVRD